MNRNAGINFAVIFFIGAIILLSYSLINDLLIKKRGIKTEGVVVYLTRNTHPNRLFYRTTSPIVRYVTKDGQEFNIRDCEYCHKVGEIVPIIYDPLNPEKAVINTKSSTLNLFYYLAGFIGFLILFLKIKKNNKFL